MAGFLVLLGVTDASGNVILRRSFAAPGLVAATASNGAVPGRGRRAGEASSHGPAFRGLGTLLSAFCSRGVIV